MAHEVEEHRASQPGPVTRAERAFLAHQAHLDGVLDEMERDARGRPTVEVPEPAGMPIKDTQPMIARPGRVSTRLRMAVRRG
jgi:hypothetical protein